LNSPTTHYTVLFSFPREWCNASSSNDSSLIASQNSNNSRPVYKSRFRRCAFSRRQKSHGWATTVIKSVPFGLCSFQRTKADKNDSCAPGECDPMVFFFNLLFEPLRYAC